jgi:NitT/TauT family transport system substrate-binding protein
VCKVLPEVEIEMRRKTWFVILGVIALGASLLNFAGPKKEKTPIRVVVLSDVISTLPYWTAVEKGFYQKEGIEPKEYSFTSSSEPVSAMANGDADFLPGVSMLDVMNGISKLRLRPVLLSHCRVSTASPFECLIVTSGSSISTLKDLEGKTIAVFPGRTSSAVLKYFLTQKGVDITNIQFKSISPSLHLQALQSGEVACAHAYEPYCSTYLEGGKMRELYGSIYASLNNPAAIGATLISYKLWAEDKPLANRLIRVWDRSIQYIRDNPVEVREILKRRLNLSDAVAQRATWVDATLSTELDRKAVEASITTYKNMGLLDPSFEFDPSYYYTPCP